MTHCRLSRAFPKHHKNASPAVSANQMVGIFSCEGVRVDCRRCWCYLGGDAIPHQKAFQQLRAYTEAVSALKTVWPRDTKRTNGHRAIISISSREKPPSGPTRIAEWTYPSRILLAV